MSTIPSGETVGLRTRVRIPFTSSRRKPLNPFLVGPSSFTFTFSGLLPRRTNLVGHENAGVVVPHNHQLSRASQRTSEREPSTLDGPSFSMDEGPGGCRSLTTYFLTITRTGPKSCWDLPSRPTMWYHRWSRCLRGSHVVNFLWVRGQATSGLKVFPRRVWGVHPVTLTTVCPGQYKSVNTRVSSVSQHRLNLTS